MLSITQLKFFFLLLFFSFIFPKPTRSQMFMALDPGKTHVDFVNQTLEEKSFNVFNYEYIFNGGGVALADFNRDGLLDILFSGNLIENKIYLNKGDMVFEDVTKNANINIYEGYKTGITIVDINNDGWPDIYECKSALKKDSTRIHRLFVNNHDMTFTERAKEYGLDNISYSTQAYFYDMDRDGDMDLFLLNHPSQIREGSKIYVTYGNNGELEGTDPEDKTNSTDQYFENVNGKFVDKTKQAGLENYSFGLSAIIADFNGDKYPDIYVANDYVKPDMLYINNKNGTFSDSLDAYFKHVSFNSMGSSYSDINNDGMDDLMVLDMLAEDNFRHKQFKRISNYDEFSKVYNYGYKKQIPKNVMQMNLDGRNYDDQSYALNMSFTDWSWTPMIVDFDNNGHKDIYVTNGYYRDITDMDFNKFYMDSVLKVLNSEKTPKNVDNLMNLLRTQKTPNSFFLNQGNMNFVKDPYNSGLSIESYSNAAAYGDLDNDGDLDIVTNNINQYALVFKNFSREQNKQNYMRFYLKDINGNQTTYGTRITLITPDNNKQYITYNPTYGYMCYNEPYVHFGIGQNTSATAIIEKINGKKYILSNLNSNKVYDINIDTLSVVYNESPSKPIQYFTDITRQSGVNYTYKENKYTDFKQEPLIPKMYSRLGPTIAVGDINGDKIHDFYVGGAAGYSGELYIQDANGRFSVKNSKAIQLDAMYEDGVAKLIDVDKDGDLDLMVTCGGNDFPNNLAMYPVRLYINDGKGNFTKATSSQMPDITTSSKTISPFDYDGDGDIDVFIGGQIVPGQYGLTPKSFLLINNNGTLTKAENAQNLENIGMVNDAIWYDVNSDGSKDLIIVGEWMTPQIIYNKNGALHLDKIQPLGNNFGWWTSLYAADFNHKGITELVFGNFGINTPNKGNQEYPLKMIVNDFDRNGSTDAVISKAYNKEYYPVPLLDDMTDQMSFLKKRFNRYEKYSSVKMNEVFTQDELIGAKNYEANLFFTVTTVHDANNTINFNILPYDVQTFPVNAINTFDFDHDGDEDLLLSGNNYNLNLELGILDGNIGLLLENKGNGQWEARRNTGYYTPGDVKTVVPIYIQGKQSWIVGKNQDAIQILQAK